MTVENSSASQPVSVFFWVAICFLISGFAALLYETVWLRQFAILFGTSDQALGIVLASYMGGLAFGSWVASRKIDQIRRPLLVYGTLELLIAISALLVPVGILIARRLQEHFLGGLDEPPDAGSFGQNSFNLLTTLGLILIPTALMGATLPLLARQVVRSDREIGPRVGLLYAINTAGAVIGTLVAAFALMPALGMRVTTWVGALCNGAVFAVVLLLVRQGGLALSVDNESVGSSEALNQGSVKQKRLSTKNGADEDSGVSSPNRILWLVGIGGAIAFCCEILFTRMLGHFLGGSVYAFATMLAGFLLGIAIGGAVASRLAINRTAAVVGYFYAQVWISIFTIFTYRYLDNAVGWRWWAENAANAGPAQVALAIGTLLPMSVGVGLAFPFAIRVLARDESDAASASAKVYSVSTLGGIVGAIGTGAWLLPPLGYEGTCTVAVIGSLCLAAAALILFRMRYVHAITIATAVCVLIAARPSFPNNVARISPFHFGLEGGRIVFNEVGKSASVTVMDQPSGLRFTTNGLPESFVEKPGALPHCPDSWLVGLPVAIRPGSQTMMIVGLGGGSAVADVPPSIDSIDVVELSEAVIRANRTTAKLRSRVALKDHRINLIINDARSAMRLSNKQYDLIVSQPSHPWTAGASHLYTKEFAELTRSRLQPGGVFLQWVGREFLDAELIRNFAATLTEVFPHVRLYRPTKGSLLWVASDQPMHPEMQSPLEFASEDADYFYSLGLSSPTDLMAHLAADAEGVKKLASSSDPIRDERNLLAMRAPRLIHSPALDETSELLAQVHPMKSGLAGLESLCPSIELPTYIRLCRDVHKGKLVEDFGIPLLPHQSQRELAKAELERSRSGQEVWVTLLGELRMTDHSVTAFHLLHADLAGKLEPSLDNSERERLEGTLSPKYQSLIKSMRAGRREDVQLAEQCDDILASFTPSEPGFGQALMMRLVWRVKKGAPSRSMRSREVIELTDRFWPYVNIEKWGYFRTLAGIFAGRDEVAFSTIAEMMSIFEIQLSTPGKEPSKELMASIGRVAPILANDVYFPNTRRDRLYELRRQFENVLGAADSLGIPVAY